MSQEDEPVRVLRVFRVEEGTSVHARILSEKYSGLFTHYCKGRSHYCKGAQCEPLLHKMDRVWKGYASVELWNAGMKKWTPVVLEISEALELDLRGLWARGQVWEFYRDRPAKKKPAPTMGKLLEEREPATMPPPFDFKAVLLHLYHVEQVNLGCMNPMPPRVVVVDSDGDGPAILGDQQTGKPIIDPAIEAEWQKKFQHGRKSPTEKKKASI